MARTISAKHNSDCTICRRPIYIGNLLTFRPGFGYVHPHCVAATPWLPASSAVAAMIPPPRDTTDKWNDLDDEETPAPKPTKNGKGKTSAVEKAINDGMGVTGLPEQVATVATDVEKKMVEELRRLVADQGRLVKGMVKGEMQEAFTQQLPTLLTQITSQVKTATTELVRVKLEEARREFKAETARAIAKIAGSGLVKQTIEIKRPDSSVTELAGEVFHPKFARIVRLATAGKPIFLVGPTGSGKTHTAMQLARALHSDKWESKFGVLSCSPATAERHFLGRSIPKITSGEEVYRQADFVRIFENGGVFCLDEVDAADPSVLLVINSAIANNRLPVPDRTENPIAVKHPDFVLIVCANTWGRGADRRYVGRNQLDEATIDRFRIGTITIGYSAAIERVRCPDTDLFDVLTHWRAKIQEHGLERVMSSRFFGDAYDMIQAGDTLEDVKESFFSGWRKEEVIKVLGAPLDLDD